MHIPKTPLFLFALSALCIAGGLGLSAEANGLDPLAVVAFVFGIALLIAGFVTLRRGRR